MVLRELQLPHEVELTKKSLVRWLALSLGLISPNESRTLMLDVLEALLFFHAKKEEPSIHDIFEKLGEIRKNEGVNPKAVRYHLLQLKNKGIISRKKGKYSFSLNPQNQSGDLGEALESLYIERVKSAFLNIRRALKGVK